MMRLSGSVKLRCDLGSGWSDGGAAGLPGFLRPSAWRCCSFSASMRRSSSAASLASASSAAIACWIFASRFCLSPAQSGISSPRLSWPQVSSSSQSPAQAAGAEFDQPCRRAQLQNLHEQLPERLQMPLAEVADRSKIRRIQRHNHHKIVPLATGLRNPPRRIQPTRIAVQQKRHHHPRIKRRLPEPAHIAARDLLEIEALPHQLNDKPRDMAFRHEVLHIRRQHQCLIEIPGAKILAHSSSLNQTRSKLNSDYSDRLLGLELGMFVERKE